MDLSAIEARIIGCLIEKAITTPDIYPLSLNALTTACNQKTNREPVMDLSESEVLDALQRLVAERFVVAEETKGSRVLKYRQRFCDSEFAKLKLNTQQTAVMCLLLLRGAQTPGELRTRSNRLADFHDVQAVEHTLNTLIAEGHVQMLAKEPGKREARYAHTFHDVEQSDSGTALASELALSKDELSDLLREIAEVKAELQQIKQHLGL
ncbi:YceH family protein [Pseudoalteromonas fenneropenaei]|uniref:YceH family protein n=1 Tax=Pseudoalteromonas fenneropenaei TaxID=1737459 RepID=A0ABV7CPG7_9GAMM